jgi:ketosteroid isomerase-like protein
VTRSNSEIVERLMAPIRGLDTAPSFRARVAGDAGHVEPAYDATITAWFELLDDDIEYDTTGMDMPDSGVVRGVGEVIVFWRRWLAEWEHYVIAALDDVVDVGPHVVFDTEVHATGAQSGVDVVLRQSQVWTLRDGKITRIRFFADRAAAMAAAAEDR